MGRRGRRGRWDRRGSAGPAGPAAMMSLTIAAEVAKSGLELAFNRAIASGDGGGGGSSALSRSSSGADPSFFSVPEPSEVDGGS